MSFILIPQLRISCLLHGGDRQSSRGITEEVMKLCESPVIEDDVVGVKLQDFPSSETEATAVTTSNQCNSIEARQIIRPRTVIYKQQRKWQARYWTTVVKVGRQTSG